jgi:hypothetical protein
MTTGLGSSPRPAIHTSLITRANHRLRPHQRLDILQGTAYEYVQNLETAGLVEQTREQRPYQYDAESIALTLSTDGETQTITPPFVAAVARRDQDEDVDVYVERHGLDGLAVALEYAYEYVDGIVTYRITARKLDLSTLEAEIILQAIEPVATEYADVSVRQQFICRGVAQYA